LARTEYDDVAPGDNSYSKFQRAIYRHSSSILEMHSAAPARASRCIAIGTVPAFELGTPKIEIFFNGVEQVIR
jgi:hypothetical protein